MFPPLLSGKGWLMYSGQIVFSQLMDFLPKHEFDKCVRRYGGNSRIRKDVAPSKILLGNG